MEPRTIFDESNSIMSSGFIVVEEEQAMIARLEQYAQTCPENEKSKCESHIKFHRDRIDYQNDLQQLRGQLSLFKQFIGSFKSNAAVELEYTTPFNNSFGVDVKVGNMIMEMVFKPLGVDEKNEIRTKFHFMTPKQLYKPFVLTRDCIIPDFTNLQKFRRDYYYMPVRHDNWGIMMIQAVRQVEQSVNDFLHMCRASCPYNPDGTIRYSSWKTSAKVEISYASNCPLIQGLKKDEQPTGAHVVGGNGSFRVFGKGNYGLKVRVDKMGPDSPVSNEFFLDVDHYLRTIKEKLGRRNMPYKQLNELLDEKVMVMTSDLEKEPFERIFYPVDFDGDWRKFLDYKFGQL